MSSNFFQTQQKAGVSRSPAFCYAVSMVQYIQYGYYKTACHAALHVRD